MRRQKKKSRTGVEITVVSIILLLVGIGIGFYLPQILSDVSLSPFLETEKIPTVSTEGFEKTEVTLEGTKVSYTANCKQISFDVHEMQAFSIDKAMKKELYARPLTHDLMRDFIESFDINIVQVRIDKYENQIYTSTIFASQQGKLVSFDSRPSDATALALRLEKPIYFNSTILQERGTDVC